jgi:hypothetical protein
VIPRPDKERGVRREEIVFELVVGDALVQFDDPKITSPIPRARSTFRG